MSWEIILAIVLILLYGYICVKSDTFVSGGWPIVFLENWERRIKEKSQEEYDKQYNYLPEDDEKKD